VDLLTVTFNVDGPDLDALASQAEARLAAFDGDREVVWTWRLDATPLLRSVGGDVRGWTAHVHAEGRMPARRFTAVDGPPYPALGADIVEPVEQAVARGAIPYDPRIPPDPSRGD
jgi:hypothetical protein